MNSFVLEPKGTVGWTVEYQRYNSPDTTSETLVAGIYIFFEDQILLVKRPHGSKANRWECGGGVVDDSESRMHAGIREVFEELGLKVVKVLSVVTDSEKVWGDKGIYSRTSFYGLVGHTNIGCIKISKEHSGFQFASKKEVKGGKIDLVNERDVKKAFEIMEQLGEAETNTKSLSK